MTMSSPRTYSPSSPGTYVGAKSRLREEIRNPYIPSHDVRIRWDNIAIVAVAIIVSIFALPQVLKLAAPTKPAIQMLTPPKHVKKVPTDPSMTMDDASNHVEQARSELAAGRFEAALTALDPIPESLIEDSGAGDLSSDIIKSQGRWITFDHMLQQAVIDQRWGDASELLKSIAAIAPLNSAQQQTSRMVAEKISSVNQRLSQINTKLAEGGDPRSAYIEAKQGFADTQDRRFEELMATLKQMIAKNDANAKPLTATNTSAKTQSSSNSNNASSSSSTSSTNNSQSANNSNSLNTILNGGNTSTTATGGTNDQLLKQLMQLLGTSMNQNSNSADDTLNTM